MESGVEGGLGHAQAWVLAGFSGHGFKFAPAVGEMLARTLAGALAPAAMTAWAAGRT